MIIRFLPSCKESPDQPPSVSAAGLQELYEMYAIDAVHCCKCPFCDTDTLHDWGYYTRQMIYSDGNTVTDTRLKIKRLRCSECGHTHAIMPWWLIPYCRFSVFIVACFLTEHPDSQGNIPFDPTTIHRYRRFYSLVWHERLIRMGFSCLTHLSKICRSSLDLFRMNFMQSRRGTAFPT